MQEEKSCLTARSHRTSEVGSLLSSCTQKQQACWWRVTMLLPGVPRNDFPNSFRCATGWWFRPRSEQPETPATAKCPDNHHCPRAQLHPEQLCPTTPSRHRAMKQRNPMQKYIMEGWSKSFLSDFSPLPHKQGMQVYPLSDSDHHRNGLHSHETHQPPCTQPFQPLPLQGWGSLESHLSLFVPVSHTDNKKGPFQAQETVSSMSHSQPSSTCLQRSFLQIQSKVCGTTWSPKLDFTKSFLWQIGMAGAITHGCRL